MDQDDHFEAPAAQEQHYDAPPAAAQEEEQFMAPKTPEERFDSPPPAAQEHHFEAPDQHNNEDSEQFNNAPHEQENHFEASSSGVEAQEANFEAPAAEQYEAPAEQYEAPAAEQFDAPAEQFVAPVAAAENDYNDDAPHQAEQQHSEAAPESGINFCIDVGQLPFILRDNAIDEKLIYPIMKIIVTPYIDKNYCLNVWILFWLK